jgi:hypothetical protein
VNTSIQSTFDSTFILSSQFQFGQPCINNPLLQLLGCWLYWYSVVGLAVTPQFCPHSPLMRTNSLDKWMGQEVKFSPKSFIRDENDTQEMYLLAQRACFNKDYHHLWHPIYFIWAPSRILLVLYFSENFGWNRKNNSFSVINFKTQAIFSITSDLQRNHNFSGIFFIFCTCEKFCKHLSRFRETLLFQSLGNLLFSIREAKKCQNQTKL